MIEKLKLEPYIPESLVAHIYSKEGHLVAERYDTIYWVRDDFINVRCDAEFDCYVDAKLFCTFAPSLKRIALKDNVVRLVLFNGAKYDLDMVKAENIPTFDFPELPNKSAFDFGGVENAASKSPLQKELNTVYVDEDGCVASDSIVAGREWQVQELYSVRRSRRTPLDAQRSRGGVGHYRGEAVHFARCVPHCCGVAETARLCVVGCISRRVRRPARVHGRVWVEEFDFSSGKLWHDALR